VAAGFFAVAIQAVIAGQIVGDVEPGDPPTVVPVQAGNVNVGIKAALLIPDYLSFEPRSGESCRGSTKR